MKGWKKIFHANGKQEKAGVAILILDKMDFETKAIIRDKVWYNDKRVNLTRRYNIFKYLCTQLGAPKYTKQLLTDLKGEIDSNTIIVGDFNTPFTSIDRSFRQKVNKETLTLNDPLDQMDLTDIYRTFHSNTIEYTFLLSVHGTFSKINRVSPQNKS